MPGRCTRSGNASSQTRRNAANAAAFTVAAMYAVIGVGAPSYTSGAHMWNGTAATLNPKPTSSSAMPTSSSGLRSQAAASAMRSRDRGEVRRARRAVHERDAVQQERRRERAEQEVLERALGRASRCGDSMPASA